MTVLVRVVTIARLLVVVAGATSPTVAERDRTPPGPATADSPTRGHEA